MSSLERLLGPNCTEGPECRFGEEMKVVRTEQLPDQSDAQIRIYNCRTWAMRCALRFGLTTHWREAFAIALNDNE